MTTKPEEARPTKRRGRPREVESPVRVGVRISATTYDALDRKARQRGVTISQMIRAAVISASQN